MKLYNKKSPNFKKAEDWSINDLNKRDPLRSAKNLSYFPNNFNLFFILGFVTFCIILGYSGFILLLNLISFCYFLYKFLMSIVGIINLKDKEEIQDLDLNNIPTYSIFLPCRNEPVKIVSELLNNINNLNYPKDKLDIILLIDEDDKYFNKILNLKLKDNVRIISASKTFPFTKPKVTNLGLYYSNSELGVIYDSEDRPEKDQLLKVVKEFQKDKDLICVQCRLNYSNKKNNLITRFFNLEYLSWFGLILPGISKSQFSKYPVVPLGGTSNHYKLRDIRELSGHDSFNVTEDAALGIEFSINNKKVKTINSVTEELAVDELSVWIKQRTRWNLGHFITYIIYTRNFRKTFKKLGLIKFLHFSINMLGNFLIPIITPILFIIFILDLLGINKAETYIKDLPWITLIGNYLLIVITHFIASLKLQKGKNCLLSLFQPFYYLLQSISSWRALYKFFKEPFKWEKTPHKETAEYSNP